MLKMFGTQLSGLFKKIQEEAEQDFEDSARLLAQAIMGQGTIFVQGFGEMSGILSEALEGMEPLPNAQLLEKKSSLTSADRVLIFSRYTTDKEAIELGEFLFSRGIPFTSIATVIPNQEKTLEQLADVHIDLMLKKGLLPDDEGNRIGFPHLLSALFVYHAIKFTLTDLLIEYKSYG